MSGHGLWCHGMPHLDLRRASRLPGCHLEMKTVPALKAKHAYMQVWRCKQLPFTIQDCCAACALRSNPIYTKEHISVDLLRCSAHSEHRVQSSLKISRLRVSAAENRAGRSFCVQTQHLLKILFLD